MLTDEEQKLLAYLSQFVSEHKKQAIEKVLALRTRYITVVLEDVYQSQNASAVVRTCECHGIQDVHIIENKSQYQVNKYVLRGAQKWMNIIRYRDESSSLIENSIAKLRKKGYRILVTDPNTSAQSIHDVDIHSGRIALMFGNELRGVSPEATKFADGQVTIPMVGFTESFNLSVSVAICLNTLMRKLWESEINFGLTQEERDELSLAWYRKIIRNSHLLERKFMNTIK
jgi:tRNA (guanosine-2'-O-)-methyltransferase